MSYPRFNSLTPVKSWDSAEGLLGIYETFLLLHIINKRVLLWHAIIKLETESKLW